MGYDITAYDEEGKKVAYLRSYMGGFRMCEEQGYNWFKEIDAQEENCEISGCGGTKDIRLSNLESALLHLNQHDPQGLLSAEGRDEFAYRKPLLKQFMDECIVWCKMNKKESIKIRFL